MASHRINLNGPWEFSVQSNSYGEKSDFTPSGTITMPRDWQSIFGETSGTASFRRKFHRPTNLEPHERVILLFTEFRGTAVIQLNDEPLGEFEADGTSLEFDITAILKEFNLLSAEVRFDPSRQPGCHGGFCGPVALEIRWDAAYDSA